MAIEGDDAAKAVDAADAAVTAHYMAYPYPARDPADEATRLIEGSPSRLAELEHFLFQGRARPSFRALFAGGGTGDGAIQLAQQMAWEGRAGEVVWLDLSPASRRIAEARASKRGLTNIRFVEGSLLGAEALVGKGFDYIDCCGVLHHLDDPKAGLAALKAVLAPDGGMGVMVYGALGRRGVYDMQDMAEALAPTHLAPEDRLALGQRLYKALPQTNWLKRNPFVRDHLDGGDAGFYDLLLHARDRAYTVTDFADLAASAGLAVVSFIEPARYDPAAYLTDPAILGALDNMAPIARAAFAERLSGNMTTHVAYLAPQGHAENAAARPNGLNWVPILRDPKAAPALADAAKSGRIVADTLGAKLTCALPKLAPAIIRRIDGKRTLADILAEIQSADASLDAARFQVAFGGVFAALNGLNLLWLRQPA